MLKDRWVFSGDAFVPWEQATVHVASHSFARGSAVFEVMSLHHTATGSILFRLDEHIRRLFQSARFLEMELQLTPESLQERIKDTVIKNGIKKGMIKVICHYPDTALDIFPPATPAATVIFAVDPETDFPAFASTGTADATACLSSWRKLDPQTVPVEAKASANYLNGMMARLESRKRGFDEAIMLDTQGFVAEGGMESVFIAKDGVLMTPAAGTILQSITRKSLLELAFQHGIESREIRIGPQQLFDADEVFLACTPFKVLPLKRIEDRYFPGASGSLTKATAGMMQRVIDGDDPAFARWRFAVE